jgi:hypothetical protein
MPPDFVDTFTTLAAAGVRCRFNFADEGWYYRTVDDGTSSVCLVFRREEDGVFEVRIWNARDPRPLMKRLMELPVHHV